MERQVREAPNVVQCSWIAPGERAITTKAEGTVGAFRLPSWMKERTKHEH